MTGTFEGVGSLQFSPDNKLAYAFSGQFGVDDNETTLLEFQTDSEYLIAKVQFNSMNELAQECGYRIYFNNVIISNFLAGNNAPDYSAKPYNTTTLIIPPFTSFKATAQNLDDSVTLTNQTFTLAAHVGGAIEQENLESISDNNKWAEKGPF